MSTLALILVSLIGIYLFLFIYWRRLREDYLPAQIFTSSIYMLFGIGLGYFVGKFMASKVPSSLIFYSNGLWFWSSLLGFALVFIAVTARFRMKTFETLEASVLGLLLWLMLTFAVLASISKDIFILAEALFILGLLLLFSLLEKKYKNFSWYKSGKVGFAALVVLGIFFLARSIVALFEPTMLSLVGKTDIVMSLAAAFLMFFAVYNLSESD